MNNIVLSTRNIDDFISDLANEVVKKIDLWNIKPQQQHEPEDQLLTVEQAAKFLKLTIPTIYSKVSRKELPVMKQGKRLYFSKFELIEYVKRGKKLSNYEIEQEASEYLVKKKGLNYGI